MAFTTVSSDPFPSDSDKQNVSTNVSVTNPNSEIVSTNNVTVTNPNFEPTVTSDALTGSPQSDCLFSLVMDSACGAITGSVVGFGYGLIENKGFKGSLAEVVPFAKVFTVYSFVKSFVESYIKNIRGKHDVYGAGVAGCCAGIGVSYHCGSQNPLPNCVLLGAVSSMLEVIKQPQPAMARSYESFGQQVNGIVPPLSLPLPNELKDSFSSFCKSLNGGPR